MSYRFNKLDMLAVDLKRKLYTIDDVEKVKYDWNKNKYYIETNNDNKRKYLSSIQVDGLVDHMLFNCSTYTKYEDIIDLFEEIKTKKLSIDNKVYKLLTKYQEIYNEHINCLTDDDFEDIIDKLLEVA